MDTLNHSFYNYFNIEYLLFCNIQILILTLRLYGTLFALYYKGF